MPSSPWPSSQRRRPRRAPSARRRFDRPSPAPHLLPPRPPSSASLVRLPRPPRLDRLARSPHPLELVLTLHLLVCSLIVCAHLPLEAPLDRAARRLCATTSTSRTRCATAGLSSHPPSRSSTQCARRRAAPRRTSFVSRADDVPCSPAAAVAAATSQQYEPASARRNKVDLSSVSYLHLSAEDLVKELKAQGQETEGVVPLASPFAWVECGSGRWVLDLLGRGRLEIVRDKGGAFSSLSPAP